MSVPNDIDVSITAAEVNFYVNNSLKAEPICWKSSRVTAQFCKLGAFQWTVVIWPVEFQNFIYSVFPRILATTHITVFIMQIIILFWGSYT